MADSAAPLLSVEEALDRLLAAVGDPLPAEEVPLVEGLDRVLAEPIASALDLPPWDNSAMDGFAVRAADVSAARPDAPVRLQVVGETRAGGAIDVEVPAGCAVRIATGAPLPPFADAVVPVEQTLALDATGEAGGDVLVRPGGPQAGFTAGEPLPEACLIVTPVESGAYIRRRGEDVRTGMRLLEPQRRLQPPQIAMAAAVGLGSLCVHRRPVAGILSTGDELRFAGQHLGASGIPDANRPGLLALCRQVGAWAVDLGIAGDSLDSVLGALRGAVERCDALIVSGGVSVGPYDVVRSAFDALGQVQLWRVAIQPGKPFAFGLSEPRQSDGRRVLLFGLPGNPVSAFVTFELFVRPALRQLSGLPPLEVRTDRAVLGEAIHKSAGRRGYLRVAVTRAATGTPRRDEQGRLLVRPTGGQGSHVLSALAAADALAVVPESVEALEAGAEVEVRWLQS